jgi:hypothetical protein
MYMRLKKYIIFILFFSVGVAVPKINLFVLEVNSRNRKTKLLVLRKLCQSVNEIFSFTNVFLNKIS